MISLYDIRQAEFDLGAMAKSMMMPIVGSAVPTASPPRVSEAAALQNTGCPAERLRQGGGLGNLAEQHGHPVAVFEDPTGSSGQ